MWDCSITCLDRVQAEGPDVDVPWAERELVVPERVWRDEGGEEAEAAGADDLVLAGGDEAHVVGGELGGGDALRRSLSYSIALNLSRDDAILKNTFYR